MKYILVFLFFLTVFTPKFSCQAQNIDDFTLFFSKWSDKINSLMQKSEDALNDKLCTKDLQEFTKELEAIKEDADKLQEKINKKGISSLNDLQNQANLRNFLEILKQITNILDDIKRMNFEQTLEKDLKFRETLKEQLNPPIVAADFDKIDNLINDVKSQTQLLAKTCFQAFLKNIPSSFCWKKGLDFGKIPQNCPSGYTRNLAICHSSCKEGYHFTLLSCWETCPSDYSDIGLFCKKSWRLKLKKTYVPSILTNFDKRVECDSGMYKFGALCYRDCAQKKLANCGSGACATDKGGCYEGILKITVNFLLGAGKFVDFILSHTQNDANLQDATSQLQEIINKIGKKFLDKAYEHVKNWVGDDSMRDFMVSSMINFTTNFIGEKFSQYLNNSMITRICNKVHDEAVSQIINSSQADFSFGGVNLGDLKGTIAECLNVDLSNNDPNDELLCIRKALQTAAGVDVTGISAMAAAFMNPVCDI